MFFSLKSIAFNHNIIYNLTMELLQGHKLRLMPNKSQRRLMAKAAGCCRFVYNKALAIVKERF
jgi:hypothetical protein